jgi:dimethylhistidine N-methyltransferase
VKLVDLHPDAADFRADVVAGLARTPKSIPPKYFYDARGAELFEDITRLPEYYLTKTEMSIFDAYGGEIATLIPPGSLLVEFGSGSARKIRTFFDRLDALPAYMPVDLSKEQLFAAAGELAAIYPTLRVIALCADYMEVESIPQREEWTKRIIFFPGSTIGNLVPAEVDAFFARCHRLLLPGDGLLIGVDLKKNKRVLDVAYDDPAGVTAEFNLNLLRRINRELDADFNLGAFEHVAYYDPAKGRIEMHLRSRRSQIVRVGGRRFAFADGETIHTENSYKYDADEFRSIGERHGFTPARLWTDAASMFSVHYFERR